jgi:hypothetical protein
MTVITTGVPKPAPLAARQEIRTLFQDKELRDLYLQGLERFQSIDKEDPLSYFQIAGIHGRYVPTCSCIVDIITSCKYQTVPSL